MEPIIIRRAESGDIRQIWNILHAEVISWSMERISQNLHDLLIIVRNGKVLGILYGKSDFQEIVWIAIHPFYSEKKLKEMLIGALAESPKKLPKNHERRTKNEFCRFETASQAKRRGSLRHRIDRPV